MSNKGTCDLVEIYCDSKASNAYKTKHFGISMLGLCYKSAILKKTNAPARKLSKEERQALDLKFDLADILECEAIDSWYRKGILVSQQLVLNQGLPDEWAGRLDAWVNKWDIGFEIVEIKASHPNMFTMYPLQEPKPYNKLQCLGYLYALNNWFMGLDPLGDLDVENFMFTNGRVMYINRGGETKPLQFGFKFTKSNRLEIIEEIKTINKYWNRYNKSKGKELPPVLGKEVKFRNKKKEVKGKNKKIDVLEAHIEPHWNCSWCDFAGVSCDPHKAKNKCGEFDNNGKFNARKGYEDIEKLVLTTKKEYDLKNKK